MRSEGYCTWSVSFSVCLSVCYHVFCNHAQRAITGLIFYVAIFVKAVRSTVYGVKTKLTRYLLPRELGATTYIYTRLARF